MNSIDSCELDDEEERLNYPLEFLNSVTPNGLPPYQLDLKIGAIVMLIRNINMNQGLCNGTRCIVRHIYNEFLDVEIITGSGN